MRIILATILLLTVGRLSAQEVLSGNGCKVPALKDARAKVSDVLLHWERIDGAVEYQVAGRKQGTTTWVLFTTSMNTLEIHHLRGKTNYEWGVRAFCPELGWTEWQGGGGFTTADGKFDRRIKDPLVAENNPVVTVYPNPSKEKAMVEIYTKHGIDRLSIKVIDALGKEVYATVKSNVSGLSETAIPTVGLTGGMYRVIVVADKFLEKRSLLIQ